MRGNSAKKIFAITILLGMLGASTASGSHLDSSFPASGPPQIQKPTRVQKRISPRGKSPALLPASRTRQEMSSLTKARPVPQRVEQKTQPAKTHHQLGWQFLLNGQPQAAMAAYRQALRHNPQSASAYLGLGMTLKSLGKVEIAKKALVKAVKLDPRLPSALVHLGYLYAEGHFGQSDLSMARRLFHQASQLGDPFAPIALLDMKSRQNL